MADREGQIVEFAGLSGASPEEARQYLEAHNWDLAEASNAWFRDAEDDNRDTSTAPAPDNYTGPRTLDGRPAPEAARSSQSARKSAPTQQRKTGIATLGSLGGPSHQHDHGDDDDDDSDPEDNDGRGNLFAGGEKSGLAVQDPSQQDAGSKKLISDILAKARANSARPEAENEAGPSEPRRFRGTGQTLGGDGVESRSIPDPLGPVRPSESQERVLHIWQDGFSIDDGDLRRFDDPANQADLALIKSGRAPLHLMNVQHDQPIDVKLHQHETPYQPQPKQYRPFGGSGQRLGAVVPGAGESSSSAAAPAAAPSSSSAPTVNDSQPTIMIRIQMPDGTRLPARFNTTHTVGDVYGFVQGASQETRSRSWVLSTTFPNKDHTDHSLVLGEMPEFKKGGTAVVKWT
ncbi:protein phosphatase regulator [Fusarium equiseti]|uniref:Protein phosphatase regulator n=1 Tax=Fusarium equiseti TaxID=61235 RepID=A0ABQ8RJE9_FUSEQ|nr:protein phosphatase regulator [Fusarium equiseti]